MSVTRRVLDALLNSPASKRRVQFDQSISGRRMAGNRFRCGPLWSRDVGAAGARQMPKRISRPRITASRGVPHAAWIDAARLQLRAVDQYLDRGRR